MSDFYTDSTQLIDGAGEFFELDNVASFGAATAWSGSVTKQLTMVGTIDATMVRAGDVITVNPNSVGLEYHRIASCDYANKKLTLETALTSITLTADDVTRYWRVAGLTRGGIALDTQMSVQERNADQELDAVAIKPDKRQSSIKVGLLEATAENMVLANGVTAADVVRDATGFTINVGDGQALTPNSFLMIGSKENGDFVTCKIQRALNTGNVSLKFDKADNAVFALDLKLINDGSKAVGKLYRLRSDTTQYLWDL